MREIKFRFFVPANGGYEIEHYGYVDEDGNPFENPDIPFPDGTIVSEFAGIMDFDGLEIFESDILEWGGIHVVEWYSSQIEGYHGFTVREVASGERHEMYAYTSKPKIIGNIYQNAELLK